MAEGNFCSYCGQPQYASYQNHIGHQDGRKSASNARGAALGIMLLFIVVLGGLMIVGMRHGASSNPLQCIPHQELVYVGYIKTLSERFEITENMRISGFSYDKGLLLYTVHLTDDQGRGFEYHYVTDFWLTSHTILTGC